MDTKTILDLNILNEQFYNKVGVEFDRTRQQYWEGWTKLLPEFQTLVSDSKKIEILDLACGNARFGRFVNEFLPNITINYLGVEREPTLLSFSEQALRNTTLSYNLQSLDIIQALLDNKLHKNIDKKFDLIMVFGLLHHVPSEELRNRLVNNLSHMVNKNGLLIMTSWQFAKLPRFSERFADPTIVGIDPEQLEKNDYILDWQRVEKAYRYCHYADEQELINLVKKNTDCKIVNSFYADGKTHQLNCYVVCKKI